MRKFIYIFYLLLSLFFFPPQLEAASFDDVPLVTNELKPFESEQSFDEYFSKLDEQLKRKQKLEEAEYKKSAAKYKKSAGYALSKESVAPSMPTAAASNEGSNANDSITNNQEQGVDEGDIVKTYKDYLVVLRRGRLFTLHVNDNIKGPLKKVSQIDVSPAGYSKGGWYDEMLISGNKIAVIGYSYAMKGTEIALFTLSDLGRLQYQKTYFLDSNDYYSSRNYASRLVNNKLVFYMPFYILNHYGRGQTKVDLPAIREWLKGDETKAPKPIIAKTDIFEPIQSTLYPTLHLMVTCDWQSSDLNCKAKGVLGPYSRNFYVSPENVYVWVSKDSYYSSKYLPERKNEPEAVAYKISLKDNSFKALLVQGSPIDQFSFKEEGDVLNVLLKKKSSGGDTMGSPEFSDGKLSILRVGTGQFSENPVSPNANQYTALPSPKGYNLQNRYVGKYLIYGAGQQGWYASKESNDFNLYIKNVSDASAPQVFKLNSSIDRIEALGANALVVGAKEKNLVFTSFKLQNQATLVSSMEMKGMAQSESRSHGFYFKSTGQGSGLLGLPTVTHSEIDRYFGGDAEVQFLKVDSNLQFSKLGSLVSKAKANQDDHCKFSCVDWYGNARPIFWKDRTFALLGYELIEGKLNENSLNELSRVNFMK